MGRVYELEISSSRKLPVLLKGRRMKTILVMQDHRRVHLDYMLIGNESFKQFIDKSNVALVLKPC